MQAIVLLKCVMVIVFLLLHMTGDPVLVMLDTDATQEDIEHLRKLMGFDQPLHVQYARFFSNALRGDFGESTEHGESAMGLVLEHFPATIEMAVGAFAFAVLVGIPFGCLAAFREGSAYDKGCVGVTGADSGDSRLLAGDHVHHVLLRDAGGVALLRARGVGALHHAGLRRLHVSPSPGSRG